MAEKRENRQKKVFLKAMRDIGKLSKREIFIAGLFLYWGEGGKTKRYTITLSNTDPQMIQFYMRWPKVMSIPLESVKVKLHLYSDMNIKKETRYWRKITRVPESRFHKPHIKGSLFESVSQRGFGHGTCNVIVDDRDVNEYVMQALKVIAEKE